MTTETLIVLTTLKSQIESDIEDIQESNPQFIPTLYAGVTIGYQTVIKYIDAALEELSEKK